MASLAEKPLVIDLENGTVKLEIDRINETPEGASLGYQDVRDILHNTELLAPYSTVIIDSATKLEELCALWVIGNVKHEKPATVIKRIEDYGWGKGYSHIYDAFTLILADLDRVNASGKNIILIAHECIAMVPNPMGEDFQRYEPRLQSPASGKASVRHRAKEWVDHLLFLTYETYAEGGKGIGTGNRIIYPVEMPTHWAKSRVLRDTVPCIEGDASIWTAIKAVPTKTIMKEDK